MNELTCRDVADFLADYLSHELAPAQRKAFETHLARCDECVMYMRKYEETVRRGKAAFDDEAPPRELVEAILAARRRAD